MKIFKKIINNVWPTFAQDDEEQKKKNADMQREYGDKDAIFKRIAHIIDEDYAKQFSATAEKLSEDERDRLKTVEGKAVTLLSATGLIISLIVNFSKEINDAVMKSPSKIIGTIILLSFFLTIIYFLRSVWYSLEALGRKGYHQLDVKDIVDSNLHNKIEYFKKIGSIMISSRVKNYDVINEKVEFVVTSHKHFKCGIVCLVVMGFLYMFSRTNLIGLTSLMNESGELCSKMLSMFTSLFLILLDILKGILKMILFSDMQIKKYTNNPQMLLIRLGLILNIVGSLFLASAVTKNTQGSHEEGISKKLFYLAIIKSPFRLRIGIILIISGFLYQILGTI